MRGGCYRWRESAVRASRASSEVLTRSVCVCVCADGKRVFFVSKHTAFTAGGLAVRADMSAVFT